jgi:hypothetical protein
MHAHLDFEERDLADAEADELERGRDGEGLQSSGKG